MSVVFFCFGEGDFVFFWKRTEGEKNLFTVLTEESSIPDDQIWDTYVTGSETNKHRKWSAWEIKDEED